MRALTYCEISESVDFETLKEKFYCDYLENIEKRKSVASVNESITTLLLLAETLGEIFGEKTLELKLKKDEKGRPFFENKQDIRFSLSHSGRYAACAVSTEGNVGVDIEMIPTDTKYEKIRERFFSEKEKNRASEGAEGFAKVWTRKEAYYKYRGGRINDLDSEKDERVEYDSFNIDGEYIITVCRDRKETGFTEPKCLKIGKK
jgi:4'-phosphopantetheinyl transferase